MERQEILRTLRERIVRYAASHYRKDAAEDFAQEALIVLEEKYAHLDRLDDLLPLALQIVRFKMMAARRKDARRGENTQVPVDALPLADSGPTPEAAAEQRILVDRLKQAMAGLGERCRDLMKYKLQGRSFPEIQKLMGAASINTIYTWDSRCRKDLLQRMGGDWR